MKKILLVEDDKFLADVYSQKLKEAGFEVNVALDGFSALRKIEELYIDLLLLDIVLPKIDGWQILEKIRKDKRFRNLKVAVLSNLFEKEDLEKGAKFGVVKYFIKAEHTPNEIVEQIKEILK